MSAAELLQNGNHTFDLEVEIDFDIEALLDYAMVTSDSGKTYQNP